MINSWKRVRAGLMVLMFIGILTAFGCSSKSSEDAQHSESAAAARVKEALSENTTTAILSTESEATGETTTRVTPAEQAQASIGMPTGSLAQSFKDYLIEEDGDSQCFDINHLNLKATFASEQSTNAVIRTLIPSFNPTNFKAYKNADSAYDNQKNFAIQYRLKIAGYETYKGYSVSYENNQATELSEFGISLPLPSAAEISKLPAVTEQVIQAAYRQGKDELYALSPQYVMKEQEGGYAFLDLTTGECFYRVLNAYSTNDAIGTMGAFTTNYKIR